MIRDDVYEEIVRLQEHAESLTTSPPPPSGARHPRPLRLRPRRAWGDDAALEGCVIAVASGLNPSEWRLFGAATPVRRWGLSHGQRELEAEATAWLVSRRSGIETRSAEYIADFLSSETDLMAISTFAILAAAHRIEARGDATRR